jgi:acyl carrier protein
LDGNLEFLGRLDHQVKVRGHRVELGEIEAELAKHPDIRDIAVVIREHANGYKHLVAYVVADSAAEISASELRDALKQKLPDYMIPAAFVILDTLPLNTNGKIDRQSLPVPELGREMGEQLYVPPQNSIQKGLCQIWEEVLEISSIGIHDNFFYLGGHSLMALRVMSKVQEVLGATPPITMLFEAPTVFEFANKMELLNLPAAISSEDLSLAAAIQGALSLKELREQGRQEALNSATQEPQITTIQELIRKVEVLVDDLRRLAIGAILGGYEQGIKETKQVVESKDEKKDQTKPWRM